LGDDDIVGYDGDDTIFGGLNVDTGDPSARPAEQPRWPREGTG
jgi:hypothetical protein